MAEIRFYGRTYPEYRFLSNFFVAPFELDGFTWQTTEHYYQAMKSPDVNIQEMIRKADKPGAAKEMGRMASCRPDWDSVKEDVMRKALRAKFANPELKAKLLATGDATLIEASPRDLYWGEGTNKDGKNRLGVLLGELRAELKLNGNV